MNRGLDSERPVLACEGLDADLTRPPLAAVRMFRSAGFKMNLKAWAELPPDVRWAIATEGARDAIDPYVSRSLMRHVPLRHVELVGDTRLPENAPLPGVLEALGYGPDWARSGWARLRPFHRFVLNVLRLNRRLLWRAFAEIQGIETHRQPGTPPIVARAEVEVGAREPVRSAVLELVTNERLLEGRGLLLARASGLRAAREARSIFDLYASQSTGAIELDWSVEHSRSAVLWQAHVASVQGQFFPVASLAAATIAAVCLCDMLKEFDPRVRVNNAHIVEEEWAVGKFDIEAVTCFDATQVFGRES